MYAGNHVSAQCPRGRPKGTARPPRGAATAVSVGARHLPWRTHRRPPFSAASHNASRRFQLGAPDRRGGHPPETTRAGWARCPTGPSRTWLLSAEVRRNVLRVTSAKPRRPRINIGNGRGGANGQERQDTVGWRRPGSSCRDGDQPGCRRDDGATIYKGSRQQGTTEARRSGTRRNATLRRDIFADRGLACGDRRSGFGHLRTNDIVLIRRQRNRRQDADDCDHDHQFNKGEALL